MVRGTHWNCGLSVGLFLVQGRGYVECVTTLLSMICVNVLICFIKVHLCNTFYIFFCYTVSQTSSKSSTRSNSPIPSDETSAIKTESGLLLFLYSNHPSNLFPTPCPFDGPKLELVDSSTTTVKDFSVHPPGAPSSTHFLELTVVFFRICNKTDNILDSLLKLRLLLKKPTQKSFCQDHNEPPT